MNQYWTVWTVGVVALALWVCVLPAFWADASGAIAVWSNRHGLISDAFAPQLGSSIGMLPWMILFFGAAGFVISLLAKEARR